MKLALALILLFALDFLSVLAKLNVSAQPGMRVILLPQNVEGISSGQASKLETKAYQLFSNYGISAIASSGDIVICPKYEIYEDNKVKTQIGNIYTIKAEVTLMIMEAKSKKEFGVYSQKVTGEGNTRDKAINKSIARFQTKSPEIEGFVEKLRQRLRSHKVSTRRVTPAVEYDADWLCEHHRIGCH